MNYELLKGRTFSTAGATHRVVAVSTVDGATAIRAVDPSGVVRMYDPVFVMDALDVDEEIELDSALGDAIQL